MHMVALTELPDAPPDVLGLLSMPNQVVPILDLRRRFKLPEATLRTDTPIVVIESPKGVIGVVVSLVAGQVAGIATGGALLLPLAGCILGALATYRSSVWTLGFLEADEGAA